MGLQSDYAYNQLNVTNPNYGQEEEEGDVVEEEEDTNPITEEEEEEEEEEEDVLPLDEGLPAIQDALDDLPSNSTEALSIINSLAQQLQKMENERAEQIDKDGCTICSNNGECEGEICSCKEGWTLQDCSMEIDEFNEIIQVKKDMIEALKDLYESDPSSETETEVLEALKSITNSSDFNNQDTMVLIDKLLDETLDLDNEKKILTEEQTLAASEVLDNVLEYMDDFCGQDEDLLEKFSESSPKYLDTLTRSSLDKQSVGDSGTQYEGDNIDIYTAKVSECDLKKLNISNGADSPSI